jgi:glyoxylase-like metal-dependent hydrolase (beta-lactamase superfamily II)
VPAGTPIYVGAGETTATGRANLLLRRTIQSALDGHAPLRTFDGAGAAPLGPIAQAYDLVGDGSLWALSTPGHTPGSQCFHVDAGNDRRLISGDTLFLEGCGRTDLPGSNPEQMYHSLRTLASLSPDTIVYPGHRYSQPSSATLEAIVETNYVFKPASMDAWMQWFGGA